MQRTPADGARTDERRVRWERAVVAVIVLAGFVWHLDVLTVVALVIVLVGLVRPSVRPLALVWDRVVAGRLRPARRTVAARQVTDGDAVLAIALGIAVVLDLVGLGLVGRVVALAAAVAAALEAGGVTAATAWPARRLHR